MRYTFILSILFSGFFQYVYGRAVFAHFMVGNTATFTAADWTAQMKLAKDAHIDGFAMNMVYQETTNGAQLAAAFAAAQSLGGFKLFLSFDYAGNGPWPIDTVITTIQQYASNPAYYKRGTQPLVSTFEGSYSSQDWVTIKAKTKCFFMPSWSVPAARTAPSGVADGLFSWSAWPDGPKDMYTSTDESYKAYLGKKPYMMPVSPWFFTNMAGYRKNWLWRGDSLWFDRWNQVMTEPPEFVQIISWNDFGESHYIGPLDNKQYAAFNPANSLAPYNYALNMPHNGWRLFLPYLIDLYKTNNTKVTNEGLVGWYRQTPANLAGCATGGTTGNTAVHLQLTYPLTSMVQDKIFFSALLGSTATVAVTIGGVKVAATWENVPDGGIGIYHGSVPFTGKSGAVVIWVLRGTSTVLKLTGQPIKTACTNGIQNWNAYVGSTSSATTISKSPLPLNKQVCVEGTGPGNYVGLCQFTCKYGYCPPVCTCTARGAQRTLPKALGVSGCPNKGFDSTFTGLCSYSCDRGYCSPSACVQKPKGTVCNAPAPVTPASLYCISGTVLGRYQALCEYTCKYGLCPSEICMCTKAGPTRAVAPALTGGSGSPYPGNEDYGMCKFACERGVCPWELCQSTGMAAAALRKGAATSSSSSKTSSLSSSKGSASASSASYASSSASASASATVTVTVSEKETEKTEGVSSTGGSTSVETASATPGEASGAASTSAGTTSSRVKRAEHMHQHKHKHGHVHEHL